MGSATGCAVLLEGLEAPMQTQTSREGSTMYIISLCNISHSKGYQGWVCWQMPLGLALRRQKQADLSEFEDTLVYKASSRPTKDYTWRPCLFKKPGGGGLLREDQK